jgi:glycosyltransferase involved in cell wall biosynthesis
VVDCQNGIPFFSPLVLPRATPVVQVLHHVHQKQFPLYFPGPVARVGQLLEAPGSRWIYRRRPVAVVSPSTRDEARAVLDLPGPRFLVPNGVTVSAVDDTDGADDTVDGSGATGSEATGSEATGATRRARVGTTGGHGTIPTAHQAAAPTIVCVGRLVPHKRLHLLIEAIPGLVARHPGLVVHIVGDGPDRERLAARATELGVGQGTGASGATLRWHGFAAAATRDALLSSAWLTVNPSHGEGWGLSVLEANALGVPAVAFRVPGLRDAVRDGETGWLVDSPARLGDALDAALARMADPLAAARMRATARRWAAGFTWETSAAMLAAIITAEIDRAGRPDHRQRDDAVTVAEFPLPATAALPALRRTDLVYRQGVSDVPGASGAPGAVAVLYGAVPAAARAALRRAGVDADVRLRAATGSDLLLGTCQAWRPASAAPAATAEPVGFGPAPLPAVS